MSFFLQGAYSNVVGKIKENPACAVYYQGLVRAIAEFIGMDRKSMWEAVEEAIAQSKVGMLLNSCNLWLIPTYLSKYAPRHLLP